MTRTIAIYNQKGGVGKTTSAINLAASLSITEKKTLLVDLDPQGNASAGVGYFNHALSQNAYHVLMEGLPIKSCILRTDLRFLDLLPSSQDLLGAEIEMAGVDRRHYALKRALAAVSDFYEFVVIDCPPAMGVLTLNALAAAGTILIPVQCEYFALDGLLQVMQTLSLIKKQLNNKLELEGILLTLFDSRNKINRQVKATILERFAREVLSVEIPRNAQIAVGPALGKPVIISHRKSVGAQAYLKLAQLLIKRHCAEETDKIENMISGTPSNLQPNLFTDYTEYFLGENENGLH